MAKRTQSIKGRGLVGSNIGASALTNTGSYVIMATLTGSYGETVHRIVGQAYWHPLQCAERAVRMHQRPERYKDVEFVNLQTGVRVSVTSIINAS